MTRRRLKIEDWPERDRAAWDALLAPSRLLRPGGPFAALRPSTIWSREQSYGHWLAFCQKQRIDLEDTDPVGRASSRLIEAWADEMADLKWTTRHTRLVGLRLVLEGMRPERPQGLLHELGREADWYAQRQVRDGKVGRVLPTDQIVAAGLGQLSVVDGTEFQDAARFRDGLMVAALALLALRISNFRDLEIGRSFLVRPGGFDILISAEAYKAGRVLEKELPECLIDPMRRYIETYRPVLLAKSTDPHDFLWVNDWGNRYVHSSLGSRLSRLTKSYTVCRNLPASHARRRGHDDRAAGAVEVPRHCRCARTCDPAHRRPALQSGALP